VHTLGILAWCTSESVENELTWRVQEQMREFVPSREVCSHFSWPTSIDDGEVVSTTFARLWVINEEPFGVILEKLQTQESAEMSHHVTVRARKAFNVIVAVQELEFDAEPVRD